jgi:hypothetical protein
MMIRKGTGDINYEVESQTDGNLNYETLWFCVDDFIECEFDK